MAEITIIKRKTTVEESDILKEIKKKNTTKEKEVVQALRKENGLI